MGKRADNQGNWGTEKASEAYITIGEERNQSLSNIEGIAWGRG